MKVTVTVTADTGETIANTVDVTKKGDVDEGVKIAMSAFRVAYPEVPPFGKTIRIDHA